MSQEFFLVMLMIIYFLYFSYFIIITIGYINSFELKNFIIQFDKNWSEGLISNFTLVNQTEKIKSCKDFNSNFTDLFEYNSPSFKKFSICSNEENNLDFTVKNKYFLLNSTSNNNFKYCNNYSQNNEIKSNSINSKLFCVERSNINYKELSRRNYINNKKENFENMECKVIDTLDNKLCFHNNSQLNFLSNRNILNDINEKFNIINENNNKIILVNFLITQGNKPCINKYDTSILKRNHQFLLNSIFQENIFNIFNNCRNIPNTNIFYDNRYQSIIDFKYINLFDDISKIENNDYINYFSIFHSYFQTNTSLIGVSYFGINCNYKEEIFNLNNNMIKKQDLLFYNIVINSFCFLFFLFFVLVFNELCYELYLYRIIFIFSHFIFSFTSFILFFILLIHSKNICDLLFIIQNKSCGDYLTNIIFSYLYLESMKEYNLLICVYFLLLFIFILNFISIFIFIYEKYFIYYRIEERFDQVISLIISFLN